MKYLAFALTFSFGFSAFPHGTQPIHLDLEARASEYTSLQPPRDLTSDLDPILTIGLKNLAWLTHINSKRAEPLSFSSKETQHGIPIEKPMIYNTEIIQKSYDDLLATLPKEMTDVLIGNSPQTDTPPIDTTQYLNFGRLIDTIYQTTVRWNSMKKYLVLLADLKLDDVRGYYFLNADTNLNDELKSWSTLDSARRAQLTDWLTQICANTDKDLDSCTQKVSNLSKEADLHAFYDHYFPEAKSHWDSYFTLENIRKDVTYETPSLMTVPFQDPGDKTIAAFLKSNIEDEWHWLDWHLIINFASRALTHIEFAAGQVPHVNGVGGNIITMDENSPLTEYNVQWAIRHEYGHTLGFQDCYIEFYDTGRAAIVSYQFDTMNLMCSRQGHLKETHYLALKQNYMKDYVSRSNSFLIWR